MLSLQNLLGLNVGDARTVMRPRPQSCSRLIFLRRQECRGTVILLKAHTPSCFNFAGPGKLLSNSDKSLSFASFHE